MKNINLIIFESILNLQHFSTSASNVRTVLYKMRSLARLLLYNKHKSRLTSGPNYNNFKYSG